MNHLKIGLRLNRNRRFVLPLLIFLLFAGGIAGLGSIRYPYGELGGLAPVLPSASAERREVFKFRVASFNIHSGRGADGNFDLSRIATELSGTDLAGLNEVRGPSLLSEKDQAAQLGEKLGMAAIFGPSERRWFITSFGNGLLSRFPILTWRSRPMQVGRPGTYRSVIVARLKIGEQSVQIIVGHVERGELRDPQLRELREIFETTPAPTILMGDLNAEPSHPELLRMANFPGAAHARVFGRFHSSKLIDHIYVRGLRVLSAEAVFNQASDHPIVWADIESPASL
ncbi:MAG TPA: endonuclease/exonuclease/phosphatase family protein [Candidatus Binatia bacterium]|jgi:endonuclease/exonuclease/phosphatase family metal-dependent hydrolase|nr:endonuclease/exonuclease/phosphatase family protein [Candidatus Binatia bacterium]